MVLVAGALDEKCFPVFGPISGFHLRLRLCVNSCTDLYDLLLRHTSGSIEDIISEPFLRWNLCLRQNTSTSRPFHTYRKSILAFLSPRVLSAVMCIRLARPLSLDAAHWKHVHIYRQALLFVSQLSNIYSLSDPTGALMFTCAT